MTSIYANLTWNSELKDGKGGKEADFGKTGWGKLKSGNTKAYMTGNGVTVVDVDAIKLKDIDKKLAKMLKKFKPNTITKRGRHYYFKCEDMPSKTDILPSVDIRSTRGLIFYEYTGGNENISYEVQHNDIPDMPKKMFKYLTALQGGRYTDDFKSETKAATEYAKPTVDEVKEMLTYIDSYEDQDIWVKIGMALFRWDEDEGFGLWDEWSKQASNYTAKGMLRWSSFAEDGNRSQSIGMGTLVKLAKDGGYIKGRSASEGFYFDEVTGKFVEVEHGQPLFFHSNETAFRYALKGRGVNAEDIKNMMNGGIESVRLQYAPDNVLEYNRSLNTYIPPSEGIKGSWSTISKLIDNLFHRRPEMREEFINWLSVIATYNVRTGIGWGFHGIEGSGKGLIVEVMAEVLGASNCSLEVTDNELESAFNPFLFNTQLVQLNEVSHDFASRGKVAGKLKSWVTAPTININMKGLKQFDADNYANFILNSNSAKPLELSTTDRRWNIVKALNPVRECSWWGDDSYNDIKKEISAFRYYLVEEYECNKAEASKPSVHTKDKDMIAEQTTSRTQQFTDWLLNKDKDKLYELVDYSENDFNLNYEIIDECFEADFYPSDVILKLLQIELDDEHISKKKMVTLLKPFFKDAVYKVAKTGKKPVRGLKLTKN